MDNSMSESLGQDAQDSNQQSPLDSVIARVQSYIQEPKLITPDTMQALLDDLMSMKDEEGPEPKGQVDSAHKGLAIMIGMPKGGGQ